MNAGYLLLTGMILWISAIILVLYAVISNDPSAELIGITLALFFCGFSLIFTRVARTMSGCDGNVAFVTGVCSLVLFLGVAVASEGFSRSGVAASIVGFTVLFFLSIALLADGILASEKQNAGNPLITQLLQECEKIPEKSTYSSSDMQEFRKKCENWAIYMWQREKNLDESYNRLLDNLFLYVDHLENFSRKGIGNEQTEWAYKRMKKILYDNGFEDLYPDSTTEFTPEFHVCVGNRESKHRRGTILNVSRTGYIRNNPSCGSPIVMRRAEVIVSSGVEPETGEPEENRGTSNRN